MLENSASVSTPLRCNSLASRRLASVVAIDALHDTLQSIAELRPELERPLPELPKVALPTPPAPDNAAIELGGAPLFGLAHIRGQRQEDRQVGDRVHDREQRREHLGREGKIHRRPLSLICGPQAPVPV